MRILFVCNRQVNHFLNWICIQCFIVARIAISSTTASMQTCHELHLIASGSGNWTSAWIQLNCNFINRICCAFAAFTIKEGPLSFVFPTFNFKRFVFHFFTLNCFFIHLFLSRMHLKIELICSAFNFHTQFIYLIYYARIEECLPFQSSCFRMLLSIPFELHPFSFAWLLAKLSLDSFYLSMSFAPLLRPLFLRFPVSLWLFFGLSACYQTKIFMFSRATFYHSRVIFVWAFLFLKEHFSIVLHGPLFDPVKPLSFLHFFGLRTCSQTKILLF